MRVGALLLAAVSGGAVMLNAEPTPRQITAAALRLKSRQCELLAKKSNRGNTCATLLFARALELGKCGPRNPQQAAALYRQIVDETKGTAAFFLGMHYRLGGSGLPPDNAKAAEWLTAAAQDGVADAQYALGTLYKAGSGVPGDQSEAAMWFQRAAKQGHVSAQAALGALYFRSGVSQDRVDAYFWWSLAANAGDESARLGLKRLVPSMSREELDKGKELVTEE